MALVFTSHLFIIVQFIFIDGQYLYEDSLYKLICMKHVDVYSKYVIYVLKVHWATHLGVTSVGTQGKINGIHFFLC